MKSRQQCEAEITAALAGYREAEEAGDNTGAEAERLVMDELIEELEHLPQQRRPS